MIFSMSFFISILMKICILTPVDTLNLAFGCSPSYVKIPICFQSLLNLLKAVGLLALVLPHSCSFPLSLCVLPRPENDITYGWFHL